MSIDDISNNFTVNVHTFSGLDIAHREELFAEIKPFWDQFEDVCHTIVEASRINLYEDKIKTDQETENNPDYVVIISLDDYVLGYLLAKEETFLLPEEMPDRNKIKTDVQNMEANYDFIHNKSMLINLMCAREESGVGQELVKVCKGLGRRHRCASLHLKAIPSTIGFFRSVGFVPYQEKEVACWEQYSDPFANKFEFAIKTMEAKIDTSLANTMSQEQIDTLYDEARREIDASNASDGIILSGIEKSRLVDLSTLKKWATAPDFKRLLQEVTIDVFSILHPDTVPMSHCLINTYNGGGGGGGSGSGSGGGGDLTEAEKLNKFGFVVMSNDIFTNPKHRKDLLDEASKFPEFIPGTKKFVMGGFAALGNPSSFHNPVVRKMRQWAMGIVVPRLFVPLIKNTGVNYNIEKYMDRMTIREVGESASPESYHRDESIYASDIDRVFGGWINLDSTSQWLHCSPKTHMTDALTHGGFATIEGDEELEKCRRFTHKIEIPPGHILVFYENMIHTVVAKKITEQPMVRLHMGWRLTTSTGMDEEVLKAINEQGVPKIKSGQECPMYSPMHIGPEISTNRLIDWTKECVQPKCKITKVWKSGKKEGEEYTIVERKMKSLKDYGFELYNDYDENERKMYQPSNSWKLLKPGSETEYHLVKLDWVQ